MTVDTVVLAGGTNSPALQAETGQAVRALVPLGSRTMLEYVVDALHSAPSVGRIVVVGNVPQSEHYTQVPSGETLMDNLFAGLEAVTANTGTEQRVLVSTSDIPFLTPASVEDFVARSVATGADFCYPIIPIACCRAAFPQMRRTTLRVREGTFTGGNLMVVNPEFMRAQRDALAAGYAARKAPLRLGAMLGGELLLRVVLAQAGLPGVLPVARLEQGVSRVMGGGCLARAIVSAYAEIGTDIDSPEDVSQARALLAQKG